MQSSKLITNNPEITKEIAKKFAAELKGGEVVCLYGDLGAGKTVFVQGMMEYFLPKKRILSPTFIIVRHYRLGNETLKRFFHVDLYRMVTSKEINDLEFFEFINKPDTIIAIEWAEKLGKLLPKERIDISITSLGEDKREINTAYVKP